MTLAAISNLNLAAFKEELLNRSAILGPDLVNKVWEWAAQRKE